jgi:glycosyltransferase involved in cell wall biosynthesis
MKILYVHYGEAWGGASRCLRDLIASLPSGYEPILDTSGDGLAAEFARVGAKVIIDHRIGQFQVGTAWYGLTHLHRFVPDLLGFIPSALSARSAIRRIKPDIVHLNSSALGPFALGARLAHVPLVWHIREPLMRGYLGFRRSLMRRFVRTAANSVVAISWYDRALLGRGNDENLTVVYDWLEEDDRHPIESRAALRARLGIPITAPVVTYLGGLSRIKGIETLVPAIEEVLKSRRDTCFIIAGCDEPPRSRLKTALVALLPGTSSLLPLAWLKDRCAPFSDAIRILGLVRDTTSLLNAADVLVFPSTMPHCGRPIVEANALGVPAIGSDFGEIREVIDDGATGYIVPPEQPKELAARIIELINDNALRVRMGEKARELVLNLYSRDRNRSELIRCYERVLRPSSTSPSSTRRGKGKRKESPNDEARMTNVRTSDFGLRTSVSTSTFSGRDDQGPLS